MSSPLYVVCAVPAERVRVSKLREVLEEQQISYEVWWWDRNRSHDEAENFRSLEQSRAIYETEGFSDRHLMKFLLYAYWIFQVIRATAAAPRDAQFYCSDFDAALGVTLVSLVSNRRFLFDNADNISLTYDWGVVQGLVQSLERFVARRATIHLLPGKSRWNGPMDNVEIVRNTPSSSMLEAAREIAEEKGYERGTRLTLYINGWLVDTRGMDTLAKAVDRISNSVDILMAGVAEGEHAEYLAEHEDVTYFGRLRPEEALALYWNAHLVLTFYDPEIEINRLAEPNKWGDCIATGTPFVVNEEVKTAKPFIEAGACFSCSYDDADALADLLVNLASDEERWTQAHHALLQFNQKPWDVSMRSVILKLIS